MLDGFAFAAEVEFLAPQLETGAKAEAGRRFGSFGGQLRAHVDGGLVAEVVVFLRDPGGDGGEVVDHGAVGGGDLGGGRLHRIGSGNRVAPAAGKRHQGESQSHHSG